MKKKTSELLQGLNAEQAAAVTHGPGPLLIIAGAGTGKTTVITRRIAWLIEQGLAKPDEILALTFTEKAAAEMEERVDRLLPLGFLNLWISTFHAFGQRILERHALDIGLPLNFKLLTQTQLWMLVRKNLERFELNYYRPLGSPTKFIHALIRHFSRAKDELVTVQNYADYAKNLKLDGDADQILSAAAVTDVTRVEEVAKAYAVYTRLLLENDAFDFGDLINRALELFGMRPAILGRYRKQFKYILIDEFQDTNIAQFELIRLLAEPGNNITVVGDDDQSIYKFRGASVSNILQFKDRYPDSRQVTLNKNYRSFQNLLDLSYRFIRRNDPDRLEVKLKLGKQLRAQRGEAGVIEFFEYADYISEAFAVARKITELKAVGTDRAWSDFAVLLRANDLGEPFIEVFERLQIPYMQLSRRGLYRKPVVLDVLAYLKLLDNYHESRAMYRVLNLPIFTFLHDDLAALSAFTARKTYSLYESLKQPELLKNLSPSGQKSAGQLLQLIEKHTALSRKVPVTELFVQVVGDLQLGKRLSEQESAEAELNFLDQFYKKIQDFAVTSESRQLKDFMEIIEMELSSGEQGALDFDPDSGPDAVKIITVHSAKGLEFPYVFVPALADKKFPSISRGEPIELPEKLVRDILPAGDFHIQEERRLFYVAMTRARDGLFFSYAKDYGGASVRKPSIFLKELGLDKPGIFEKEPAGKVALRAIKQTKKRGYALPKTFSFSSVSTFRKCPLEYKYTYIIKIPRAGSAALSFGQTFHRTLELFLRQFQQAQASLQGDLFAGGKSRPGPTLPEFAALLKLYQQAWIDDWYLDKKQKADYKNRGVELLKMVYNKFKQDLPKPKYLEQNFKLGLGNYVFTGKIDRGDETPDGLRIIDYKTGAARTLGKVDKEQLLIYQCAADEFLKEKAATLQYWYFNNQVDVQSFLGTGQQILQTKQSLLETIEKIVEATVNDSFKTLHVRHQNCEFEDFE